MKLTRRQLYDYRDPTWQELILVRAGHHLWALRRKLGCTVHEQTAIDAALETVWEAKKQVKADIAARNREEFAKRKDFFERMEIRPDKSCNSNYRLAGET